MNDQKRFHAITRFIVPVVFLAFIFLCSRIPLLAEAYMHYCYPVIATILSYLTHWVPFSLLDVLIILAIATFLAGIVMMCIRRLSVRCWANILLLSVLWLVVWFYMTWGIGYFRLDFHQRFAVDRATEDKDFFEAFVIRYIDSLNHAYIAEPQFDINEIDHAIETMYEKYHQQLQLPYPCGKRHTKRTLTEPLMTRMGVAGYFDPFFNEVQVNNFLLPVSYPFTLAHEKAHQFGIASESECNLYASIVCTSSHHPLVRYSGYMQTVSYLLGSLRRMVPDEYKEITARIDPRVIADFRRIEKHWKDALNPKLSAVQDKVYDSYLKTNKQQSGIRSYSEMVELLLAWENMKKD